MTEFSNLPPEENLPEEYPFPAPDIYPPPKEGSAGNAESVRSDRRRGRRTARQKVKSALMLAVAGAALCGVIYTAPMKPPAAVDAPAGTNAAQHAALTAADRLVMIGTWKNDDENEWVHFNGDGTGWWYDGTYFGRMVWQEEADGGVTYEAAIAYLGPGNGFYDQTSMPEKEGDVIHRNRSDGSIALLADEDRFTCPGLLFGAGSYLPDHTDIDASVMEGILKKSAVELVSGTTWYAVQTSDLGIPCAPSDSKPLYTDQVYVQSIDFAAGILRLVTRDGGLLNLEIRADDQTVYTEETADTLDLPFTSFSYDEEVNPLNLFADVSHYAFVYYSDYIPGDTGYNNDHLLWGRSFDPDSLMLHLLVTTSELRLCVGAIDLYPNNYTILAQDTRPS